MGRGALILMMMLAAPLADRVAADCYHMDLTNDDLLLTNDYFIPGLRRIPLSRR